MIPPIKALVILLCPLLLLSCARYQTTSSGELFKVKDPPPAEVCRLQSMNIFHSLHPELLALTKRDQWPRHFSASEQFVLWSLLQMKAAPHYFTAYARHQLLFLGPGASEQYYLELSEKEILAGSFRYFSLWQHLLKSSGSRRSLPQLAGWAQRLLPGGLNADGSLVAFIQQHRDKMAEHPPFKRIYFKGEFPLELGESYRPGSLGPLFKQGLGAQVEVQKLSPQKKTPFRCNYSHDRYVANELAPTTFEQNAYHWGAIIRDTPTGPPRSFLATIAPPPETHLRPFGTSGFMLQNAHGLKLSQPSSEPRTPRPPPRPPSLPLLAPPLPYCVFSTPERRLALNFSSSRDPAQQLSQLLSYQPEDVDHAQELATMLGFSRYLFLEDPPRVLFETRRAYPHQLEDVLKLQLPLYHIHRIGQASVHLHERQVFFMLADPRWGQQLNCHAP